MNLFDNFDIRYHTYINKCQFLRRYYKSHYFIEEFGKIYDFAIYGGLLPTQLENKTCHLVIETKPECREELINAIKKISLRKKCSKFNKLKEIFSLIKLNKSLKNIQSINVVKVDSPYDLTSIDVEVCKEFIKVKFSPNFRLFINLFKAPYRIPAEEYALDICGSQLSIFYSKENIFEVDFIMYNGENISPEFVGGNIYYCKEYEKKNHLYLMRTDIFGSNVFSLIKEAKEVITERTKFKHWL